MGVNDRVIDKVNFNSQGQGGWIKREPVLAQNQQLADFGELASREIPQSGCWLMFPEFRRSAEVSDS